VALSRLLSLARITAPQALEIGASVLEEAAARPHPDTGSAGGDRVTVDQVVVRADGRAVLCPVADGTQNGRSSPARPAGPGVDAVLTAVAGAARHGRLADPAAEQVLTELDRAVTELPVVGVPAVARMLQEATTAIDRGIVRAELGALVGAIRTGMGSAGGTEPTGASSSAVRGAAGRRATKTESRTTRRRIGAWLLSVVVLAGVVLVEVLVLRDKITSDIGLLLDAGRGGAAEAAAPASGGRPIVVPAPAPATAGSVAGVDLRALAPCAPGAPCTLRLLVRLEPGAGPQVVTWSYLIVDGCTGATATTPGGTVTVPPGVGRAVAVGTVALPAVQAVAVVAITDLPAAAASRPVLVGSCAPAPQAK
jgi:hypothetical protein